jgi:hypothetical protein
MMAQDTQPAKAEVQHDEAPPPQDDHAFVPRGEWWSLCDICNLAESAHRRTTLQSHIHYYDDDID